MRKPIVQPLDQTSESALVTNVVIGANLELGVNGVVADHLALNWSFAANARFGDLADDSHVVLQGRFSASGKEEILFYNSGDGNWWLGTLEGPRLTWADVAIAKFGDLNDGNHLIWTGNFTGHGRSEVLFYYSGDNRWWLVTISDDGAHLSWGEVSRAHFGNLLDGRHRFFQGDFGGAGVDQIAFYYAGDGNWWAARHRPRWPSRLVPPRE